MAGAISSQHLAEDLRLDGQDDDVGPPHERHVVRDGDDAVEPLQLLEPISPDVCHEQVPDRHQPRLGETPDEGLAHVAPTHEPDPLVPDRHGQSSPPSATSERQAFTIQPPRGPKIAVPTRTIVAPSSIADLEVAAHPHRQLRELGTEPPALASSSSFRMLPVVRPGVLGVTGHRRDRHEPAHPEPGERCHGLQRGPELLGPDAALLRLLADVDLDQHVDPAAGLRRPARDRLRPAAVGRPSGSGRSIRGRP